MKPSVPHLFNLTAVWARLSVRDRRAIAMGAAIVACGGVLTVAAPRVRKLAALQASVAHQRHVLDQELATIRDTSRLTRATTFWNGRLRNTLPQLFVAADDVTAAAALARYVQSSARVHRVAIDQLTTRVGRASTDNISPQSQNLIALRVDINARSDAQGVIEWLNAIENGSQLVRVDGLHIERVMGGSTTAMQNGSEVLHITTTLVGYTPTHAMRAWRSLKRDDDAFAGEERSPTIPEAVQYFVDHDPFTDSRVRPATRFTMPGDTAGMARQAPVSVPAPVKLVGTVVLANRRGFAICQTDGSPPQMVHLGEHVNNLTLTGLIQGEATFTDDNGRHIVLRGSSSPSAGAAHGNASP
jgi:type II secretory pathway component PulM